MKPFDPTKPVQYRNGEKAELLTTKGRQILNGENYPIITEDRTGSIRTHKIDGHASLFAGESDFDLINIPEKRKVEMWVNMNANGSFEVFRQKSDAGKYALSHRIACLHIVREYEEGEGL